MFNYIWPIMLIVLSNTFYQICAKSVPGNMNPFASLVITYLVGALVAVVMYFVTGRSEQNGTNLMTELAKTNWAPFLLGFMIVGLEVGYIYAFKAGWPVSMAQIVQGAILGVILIFVGRLLYHEAITWNRVAGIIVCLGGLALINLK